MMVQLILVGVLLIYWFCWDNMWLNLFWVVVMVGFVVSLVVQNSVFWLCVFFVLVFLVLLVSGFGVLLLFNVFILLVLDIFLVQYLIIIGGMLLGNVFKGIVVGFFDFYQCLQDQQEVYCYYFVVGVFCWEVLIFFFCNSLQVALNFLVVSMVMMGVVFLLGMMMGQIIGGVILDMVICYQLVIMVVIFVCIVLSVVLGVVFSLGCSFDVYGNLWGEVFWLVQGFGCLGLICDFYEVG